MDHLFPWQPKLDLRMRRNRDGQFLTGRWGGVEIRIVPLLTPDPDDPLWRWYERTCQQGVDHDRDKPTCLTIPEPTGWGAVRERQHFARRPSLTQALAAVGHQAPFHSREELQSELGFDLDDQ
jgi:hypothetical protein